MSQKRAFGVFARATCRVPSESLDPRREEARQTRRGREDSEAKVNRRRASVDSAYVRDVQARSRSPRGLPDAFGLNRSKFPTFWTLSVDRGGEPIARRNRKRRGARERERSETRVRRGIGEEFGGSRLRSAEGTNTRVVKRENGGCTQGSTGSKQSCRFASRSPRQTEFPFASARRSAVVVGQHRSP